MIPDIYHALGNDVLKRHVQNQGEPGIVYDFLPVYIHLLLVCSLFQQFFL